ncbi:helix-turn-helix transcriptional regulator [Pedobacter sp. GSP4]|uniref:helix-turn-helix transcriptional regulator n=1 Tax=Pedobacter sp. GSP4 TaxID=3453716 RepID=UPI003EE892C5
MKYFLKRWGNNNPQQKLQQLKNHIISIYINKDLIDFFEELSANILKKNEKIYYLEFCKKIVLQYNRKPDKLHYQAFKIEYDLFFQEIKNEQCALNPSMWLEAELRYLRYIEGDSKLNVGDTLIPNINKEWLTTPEVIQWLGISKANLHRKVASGLPKTKIGRHVRFAPEKVREWIASQNN